MIKYDIFISYRRDGGEALACLISERLKQRDYKVFYDVESLRSGKFNEKIYNVIDTCGAVLIVLPANGLNRCWDEEDWVRKEIVYAIRKEKKIIPIMMRNFEFPKELPDSLKELPNYHGISANMEYFDAVFEKIIEMVGGGKNIDESKDKKYIKDEEALRKIQHWRMEIRENNSHEARYQLADYYYREIKKEVFNDEIFDLCKVAANAGHVKSQNLLGVCYEIGIGTEKNIVKAFEHYKIAAEHGLDVAQFNVAQCFEFDYKKLAAHWMKMAASQEYPSALKSIGDYYDMGYGVEKNHRKAEEYYMSASKMGHEGAKKEMRAIHKIVRFIKNT